MGSPTNPLAELLRRWSLQQGTALHQMTERKTAGQRVAGFSKSERVDAKFFLLAIAPFALVMVSRPSRLGARHALACLVLDQRSVGCGYVRYRLRRLLASMAPIATT